MFWIVGIHATSEITLHNLRRVFTINFHTANQFKCNNAEVERTRTQEARAKASKITKAKIDDMAKYDLHRIPADEIFQRFSTHPVRGLDPEAAASRYASGLPCCTTCVVWKQGVKGSNIGRLLPTTNLKKAVKEWTKRHHTSSSQLFEKAHSLFLWWFLSHSLDCLYCSVHLLEATW